MGERKNAGMEEAALRLVVEGTASETGAGFFRALVKNLAAVTGTAGAWVTEYLQEAGRLRSYAFWLDGQFVEQFEYDVAGTACAPVVDSKKMVHIPDRLIELYPTAQRVLATAVSYLGVPLLDLNDEVMGHLAVLDTSAMPADPRLISLFQIFASRAAAEQRRLRQEMEIRVREEELSALLNSAMDAVVVLDAAGGITRVNPAAERLFGCTAEDLLGENLREFLPPESAAQFSGFIKELDAQSVDRRQLWIPHSFPVVRWDKSSFPAEATISGFVNRGKVFHTVILRNVDERLAAERRIALLAEETEYLRESVRDLTAGMGDVLGSSPAMRELFESVKRVAVTDATVLIFGETGTGKELIARSIHKASARKDKPLVRVNCAAIPGALMESEFFGHERGAFTGATARRDGRFILADGGTIFLDEVGELPLDLQAKLLRVLQEGEFEPLGSARTRKVDVRVVAATNRNLSEMVREGKFREDLFYRLNVFPLRVPPLRERGNDIALLARAFAERYARSMGRRLDPLQAEDILRLQEYAWPGNVRELQNVLERAIILSTNARLDLNRAMPEGAAPAPPHVEGKELSEARIVSAKEMESFERANIKRALAACAGKIAGENGAASRLGLPPSTLSSRMKALGIQRPGLNVGG
jgi:PAS domain S-box-containing protein